MERETVVITGASAAVGRATARAFGARKARVGLIARGREGLEAAKREIELAGGEALVIPLDVSDHEAVEQAAAEVEKTFGPIDIWINNAMLSVFSPIMAMKPEEYKRVTEVTYLGYVYGTLAALRRMKPRDRGVIVQVGSALAYRGIPLQSAYSAAKHAVQGFHDSLLSELIHDGSNVRVVMVQMPALNTPQFRWVKSRLPRKAQPVPPIFQPEVAAEAIVWAAYSGRREINVGWPTTKAVVGNNFFPGYGDVYLARHGYEAQMIDEPEDPGRPDNLWAPLPGDHGAHGVFDAEAKDRSVELELNRRRPWVFAGSAPLAGMLGLAVRKRRPLKDSSHDRRSTRRAHCAREGRDEGWRARARPPAHLRFRRGPRTDARYRSSARFSTSLRGSRAPSFGEECRIHGRWRSDVRTPDRCRFELSKSRSRPATVRGRVLRGCVHLRVRWPTCAADRG